MPKSKYNKVCIKICLHIIIVWFKKIVTIHSTVSLLWIVSFFESVVQEEKKGKSLTKSYCNEKFNTISKKCWPHCVVLESESRFPPIFFLFSCGLDSFHSLATFNRSQEELFLSSLANNSDAKHLFKATFVIPEGRHYYILQRFLYASIFC